MTATNPPPDDDPTDLRILRLNAALDDELDAANRLTIEREIAGDPELRAQYEALAATRTAIRRAAPRETAPASLRASVIALAASAETPALAPRRRIPPGFGLAASFACGALLASLVVLGVNGGSNPAPGERSLVADFTRTAVSGQPFDIASSDRHTVKPWFASRVTVGVAAIDLAADGFPLAGGRVSIVDRILAPTLVYRRREHLIAVTELPPGAALARGPANSTLDGYHIARWSDAELSFVAVSDIDPPELAKFVLLFQKARATSSEPPP
jgi:anti-sigma factor RsiW